MNLPSPWSIQSVLGQAHGLLALNDPIPSRAVLAFRGTADLEDVVTDTLVLPVGFPHGRGQVHEGFLTLWERLREQVLADLDKLPPALPLTVTGHSLGGAVALLAAADLGQLYLDRPLRPIQVVTFGCPKVGNLDFALNFQAGEVTAVRNFFDVVPWLPSWEFFVPTGEVQLLRFGHWWTPEENHSLVNYRTALEARA